MHKFTVQDAGGHVVGSGEIMALTAEQLADRGHRVEMLDEERSKLTRVRVIDPLQFKAGEVLHLDRLPKSPGAGEPAAAHPPATAKPKREKRDENGDTPEMAQMRAQFDAAYAAQGQQLDAAKALVEQAKADGIAAGRHAMLEEIKARNAVIDAAETAGAAVVDAKKALDAESDADKRKPLQKALDAALEAEETANKAVDDLGELKV